MEALDEARVPVVLAGGQVTERAGGVRAIDLAVRAADEALDAVPDMRRRVGRVSMVNVMSPVGAAPAATLARRCGLAPARTEVSTIGGNSPQWLVNRAAADVAAGEVDGVLVVGAEALHTARLGGPPPAGAGPPGDDGPVPDPVVGDDRAGVGAAELGVGLIVPVQVYAMFESVLARRAGRTPEEHRAGMGRLMARFSAVAAANPHAWYPEARTPEELAAVTPDNRLVSEPYPKRMCAVLHVDQAAAVLVTSLAAARAAGAADRAVFCWSGGEATDVWFPSARPDPGSSPGLRAAAAAAMAAAGLGVDDIGAFDLYSCFPSAVEMALEALGLAWDDGRGFTVTGGLPYFGGPGNNYSLHAVVAMADRLRRQGGTGLVSALGWYATKHAVGVYGTSPPARGWRRGDTTAAQRAIDASAVPVAVAVDTGRPAEVVASTVAYARDGAVSAAPVIARLGDGRHVVAAAEEDELPSLSGHNLVGRPVMVAGSPPRYRLGP